MKVSALALRPTSPKPDDDKGPTAQQDVFLREVDDALRQDEVAGAFKRYGRMAGATIVIGLVALAGYLWWGHHTTQLAGERGEQITMALDRIEKGQVASGDQLLIPLTNSKEAGSRATAQLLRAGVALGQGRKDEALKLYRTVSADNDAPKPLRDLALIRAVAASLDEIPPQQVVDQLKPLAIQGNPWFGSAGELVGMAYMKQGKNDLAGPLFAAISRDTTVPESLRNRTRQLAGLLGVDAIDDVAKAANPGGQ
jgi:hypothetical protein